MIFALRTNPIKQFYFSIFLTCYYRTKVEKMEKISQVSNIMPYPRVTLCYYGETCCLSRQHISHCIQHIASSLAKSSSQSLRLCAPQRLPHSFVKLQSYEVVSTYLVSSINSTTHNASSNARSHIKQMTLCQITQQA